MFPPGPDPVPPAHRLLNHRLDRSGRPRCPLARFHASPRGTGSWIRSVPMTAVRALHSTAMFDRTACSSNASVARPGPTNSMTLPVKTPSRFPWRARWSITSLAVRDGEREPVSRTRTVCGTRPATSLCSQIVAISVFPNSVREAVQCPGRTGMGIGTQNDLAG